MNRDKLITYGILVLSSEIITITLHCTFIKMVYGMACFINRKPEAHYLPFPFRNYPINPIFHNLFSQYS